MILFRCSYCGRGYTKDSSRIGDVFSCVCGQRLKVPKRSGKSAKHGTWGDFFIEMLIYGGAGAVLGFFLGVLLVSQIYTFRHRWLVILSMTLAGLLVGTFGGERGINWIGRIIRDREQR